MLPFTVMSSVGFCTHGSSSMFRDFILRVFVFWLFNVQASFWIFNIQGSEHICGEVLSANPPLPLSHADGPYPGSFLLKGMLHEIAKFQ